MGAWEKNVIMQMGTGDGCTWLNCEIEASYECHTGFTDEPITAGTPWAAQIVWDNKADDPIAGEESICYNCGNEVWELGEECDNADGTGDGCTDQLWNWS
jgi:hypothetical protein